MALLGFLGPFGWIIGLIAAIWVIYDIFTANKRISTLAKVIWVVLALVLSWGGSIILALVYWLMYKK